MTYQEERKIKDAEKAKRAKKYRYEPVLFDRCNPPKGLMLGDLVVKIQPYGCPKNGTMGMTYVGHPETGEFIGLVCLTSLVPSRERMDPGFAVFNSHINNALERADAEFIAQFGEKRFKRYIAPHHERGIMSIFENKAGKWTMLWVSLCTAFVNEATSNPYDGHARQLA